MSALATGGGRRGYTLLELMVVNVLMGVLMLLIAGAWRAFGPLCVEVIARGRIAGEANVAAASLYHDMHHYPSSWTLTGVQVAPDGQSFSISYQRAQDPANQPWTVTYQLEQSPNSTRPYDGRLTRADGNGSITIARHVEAMTPTSLGKSAEVKLSLFYRNSRSQYTFEVVQ